MTDATVRAAFRTQAEWARRMGAPFTEALQTALGEVIDRSTAVGRRVLDWPGEPIADALVIRLLGGLHALVRSGDLPALAALYPPHPAPDAGTLAARLAEALADADVAARLLPWLDSPPQTNEVGRSAVLMAGLRAVAAAFPLPLRTVELGASGGLNLRLDAYAYDLGGDRFGPADAPLTLAPAWTGPPPPAADVRIAERIGVDIAPLDVARDRDRLLAYVWPDQPARAARLAAAIDAFVADPAPLVKDDAADFVEANVAPQPGVTTVVLHSIAFQYFPAAARARIAAHLDRVGAGATPAAALAWLRYEFDGPDATAASLRLVLWPDGDRLLARAHPHGAKVEWLG
ncbi:MAG: DUF2332 family protein [Sphingomonadaceae bacterium]|nr:DUF2332 family protein [Sphingomonadaceae bacterium]